MSSWRRNEEESTMQRCGRRGTLVGAVCAIGLVASVAWAQTAAPPAKAKLERLKIAVAPLGWDTNFSWLQSRSGNLDKRPALEFLVSIDRNTGMYIPELAEKWEMSPDGKHWTITLRKGIKFHDQWGEFTAKDVRHSVFLITQPESVQSDSGVWRTLIGVAGMDPIEAVAKKVEEGVQIIDDYQVVFRLKHAAPEFLHTISANTDLVMESKARWDAGGKELYGKKVVGTGPFEFVERKVGVHVLYKRVENHWRKTPEYKELEWRWVPEGVTRLATLLTEEVNIETGKKWGSSGEVQYNPRMSTTIDVSIYQLKVVLLGISPMIWRRLLVRGDSTIADLHHILQIAMGWTDTHLHQFRI